MTRRGNVSCKVSTWRWKEDEGLTVGLDRRSNENETGEELHRGKTEMPENETASSSGMLHSSRSYMSIDCLRPEPRIADTALQFNST